MSTSYTSITTNAIPINNWTGTSLTTSSTYTVAHNNVPTTLKVSGDADISGDIKLNGKSLSETLDSIEERLAILHPNVELEEKWDQLKGLRKLYVELEAEIIEKEKMWAILKK